MPNKQSDFWYYTRSERRATVALLLLVVIIFLLPAIYDYRTSPTNLTDHIAFQEAIQQLEAQRPQESPRVASAFYFDPNTADQEVLVSLGLPAATAGTIINYREKVGLFRHPEDLKKIYNLSEADYQRLEAYISIRTVAPKKEHPKKITPRPTVELFPFDPNTVEPGVLARLGFSQKVAGTLIRYREKGGRFYKKEDLKKIYGLREQDYQKLEAYIAIPEAGQKESSPAMAIENAVTPRAVPASYETPIMLDINRATVSDWQQLRGIGPVLSGRIVKFRDKLGGFSSPEQVAETYGLADSTFQEIRQHLVSSEIIQQIAINEVTARQLQAHPYIKWQQANVIIAYREQHGPYGSLDDLKKVLALDEAFLHKMAPYFRFE